MKRAFVLAVVVSSCASPPKVPQSPPPQISAVDSLLQQAWKDAQLVPSPGIDDATFLRRVTLDLTGTIPTASDVNAFLRDASPNKRARLVDSLLASPGYADHFTNYWDDVLMGDVRGGPVDRGAFRSWLRDRFVANTPWNTLVHDLVDATGQNSLGGPRVQVMAGVEKRKGRVQGDLFDTDPDAQEVGQDPKLVKGAVNYTLRFFDSPQDIGGNAARSFLGIQIQCAQCHDHKTEAWKQEDFRRFTVPFYYMQNVPLDRGAVGGIRRLELRDTNRVAGRLAGNPELNLIAQAHPTALDGTDLLSPSFAGKSPRAAMADWITSPTNTWFAKAIVNRMWGHLLGRGFVDPVDDLRPSNPVALPQVFDALTLDFVKHGYDLRALLRTIALSDAYARSSAGGRNITLENDRFARFRSTPLGPEELLNGIFRATEMENAAPRLGIKNVGELRAQVARAYSFLFDVDEDADHPSYEGTVSQALTLMNGGITNLGSRALPGTALDRILRQKLSEGETVQAIYLQVLSRPATEAERALAHAHLEELRADPTKIASGPEPKHDLGKNDIVTRLQSKLPPPTKDPTIAAYEDLFWVLLNSSEFVLNH